MTSCLASYAIYSSINTIYLFYFAGKNFKHFTKFYSFSHFCSARSSANSRNFLAFPSFAGDSRKIISETGWKREFVFEYHASLATKILSNQFFKVEITWNGALRICRLNGDWLNAEKISEMSWKGKKNASTFVPELNAFFLLKQNDETNCFKQYKKSSHDLNHKIENLLNSPPQKLYFYHLIRTTS